MLKKLQHNPILTITVLVLLMLTFGVQYLSVSIMEARNFITAREMLTDGNWLLTTMNGEARYEKPPLPTWLAAFFGMIFGIKNLLAIRFPAIIFIAITGVFTYLLSNKLLNNKNHSLINALIVVTSFYVIGISIEAPWDIFTHGFMLMAIYFLFQYLQGNSNNFKAILLAGLFLGCSILCKGPVSFYALLLPFLIAYGMVFKFTAIKKQILPLLAFLIIGLIVGGWWYLYVRLNDPATFTAIAERETGNWSSYNIRPFYYYWSFFTQSGIWTIPAFISLLYPYLKRRVSNTKAYRFSFIWTITAVILLSLIPEKKSRYLMPVLIPLAINTGFYIEYLIRCFKDLKDKRETIPVYFNFGLIALIGLAFPIVGYLFLGEKLSGYMFPFAIASITLVLLSVLIFVQLKLKNMEKAFYLTIFFFAALLISGLPLSTALIDNNYKPISNLKEDTKKEAINVYGFNYISPEMIWQFGDKIPNITQEDGTINFPDEPVFGMLANGISPEHQELLLAKYHIEKVATYDLNTSANDSKSYRGRLVNTYYILTKK
ncbi:ArnT family glycosyltransferase [Gaetbulibacter jejuensis]|uniref:ArnT family glycosyltransferase n=1 Tax=Gaetbulibacter jejuensis TaxID=584607 RepID=UPI0030088A7F